MQYDDSLVSHAPVYDLFSDFKELHAPIWTYTLVPSHISTSLLGWNLREQYCEGNKIDSP